MPRAEPSSNATGATVNSPLPSEDQAQASALPVSSNAYQSVNGGGLWDAFVTVLNASSNALSKRGTAENFPLRQQ